MYDMDGEIDTIGLYIRLGQRFQRYSLSSLPLDAYSFETVPFT
jgi:hypothetical protein